MTETTFTPTERAREIALRLADKLNDDATQQFFELWEVEDDPRRAGAILAHMYAWEAAKIAIAGAMFAGKEPDIELWLALCKQKFTDAKVAWDEAFKDQEG